MPGAWFEPRDQGQGDDSPSGNFPRQAQPSIGEAEQSFDIGAAWVIDLYQISGRETLIMT